MNFFALQLLYCNTLSLVAVNMPGWIRLRHFRFHYTAYLAVVLTLFLSFASLAHQLDFNPEHHLQHHCEQFASASHGLGASLPQHTAVTAATLCPVFIWQSETRAESFSAYLARSPPYLTYC
ncbi:MULTISPECIES: DUF2607 family protein [Vibrio]|nr:MULTISPECIES: DUF2607 family protein [Vibrio]KYN80802.1 hypothetical protein ATY35_06700 [Vibrio cidicii]KYN81479.1 hypothetical protein ATY36_15485 [Vibrio cidicii]